MKKGDRDGRYSVYNRGVVKQVKLLQKHMNRLGFRSGPEDGIFGPITDGAVKRMQKFLGTKQDGIVGPITRSLINHSCQKEEVEEEIKEEVLEEEKNEEQKEAQEILAQSKCPYFISYQKVGDKGDEIKKIQAFLKTQGIFNHSITGYFGPITDQAIKSFQEKYSDEILKPWGMSKASGW